MTRLIDLYREEQITKTEYDTYLAMGYKPSDIVQIQSGRSAEMVTTTYMNLSSGRSWTLKAGETVMGYIGPTDLNNAGAMTIAGDALFYVNTGAFTNTGTLTVTGTVVFKDY
jgi:hypothetical protein